MKDKALPHTISTGTYLAGLWLVLLLIGSLVMYPLFMEGLAQYVQEDDATQAPGAGFIASIPPRVIYYLAVAQVAALGVGLVSWIRRQLKEGKDA